MHHNYKNGQIVSLLAIPVDLTNNNKVHGYYNDDDDDDDDDNDNNDDILDDNERTPIVQMMTRRKSSSSSRCCEHDIIDCCSRKVRATTTTDTTTATTSRLNNRLSLLSLFGWQSVVEICVEGCAVLGISLLTHAVFHNPLCGLVFRCGCTFNPWLGGTGWLLCNVHKTSNYDNDNNNAVVADEYSPIITPRCPWCKSSRDTPKWTWTTGKPIIVLGMMIAWAITTTIMVRMYLCTTVATTTTTTTTTVSRQSRNWLWLWYSKWHHNWQQRLFRMVIIPLVYFFLYHVVMGLVWCIATGYPYWLCFTFPNRQPASAPLEPILNAT